MNLTDIYRSFHLSFFSAPHGTLSKYDHILSHKASLNRYKKIEIIPYIFSDYRD